MPSDTPITDELYAKVCHFRNEDEATEACATMRDKCRDLERENAKLRELCANQASALKWAASEIRERQETLERTGNASPLDFP